MKKISCVILFIIPLQVYSSEQAEINNIFEVTVEKPMDVVYPNMMASLEQSPFYLFYEMNIGKNLAFFTDKWGHEYNKNNISAVQSIVFCNGWFLNKAGNKDTSMLGLCPMHVSLVEKSGVTTAYFVRPTVTYKNSPALDVLVEIEAEVVDMVKNGMR